MTDFAVTNGASFRMVLDVGDWDESRVINTPGQSGDPESPHYGDLFSLWAEGRHVPLAPHPRGCPTVGKTRDHAHAQRLSSALRPLDAISRRLRLRICVQAGQLARFRTRRGPVRK